MSNRNATFLILFILLISTGLFMATKLKNGGEDNWICQNNQWVKHGQPTGSQPTIPCGQKEEKEEQNSSLVTENIDGIPLSKEDIKIMSPQSNEVVGNPILIEGEVRGDWFFEGSFPVKILNDKGEEIGIGPAEAMGEWMKDDWVPFRAIININNGLSKKGTIVFTPDDPSDSPESLRKLIEVKLPITFSSKKTQLIKLFFGSSYYDFDGSFCKSYPVKRLIAPTKAVARAAIEELLQGPNELEKKAGFSSGINSGVKIRSLTISNGIARIDFDEKMEEGMGGSCRVNIIHDQINQTLKQFSTVQEVIISVNGQTEGILQP